MGAIGLGLRTGYVAPQRTARPGLTLGSLDCLVRREQEDAFDEGWAAAKSQLHDIFDAEHRKLAEQIKAAVKHGFEEGVKSARTENFEVHQALTPAIDALAEIQAHVTPELADRLGCIRDQLLSAVDKLAVNGEVMDA